MSQYKNNTLAPAADHPLANGADRAEYQSTLRNGRMRNLIAPEGHDVGEWDSYRRWLNRVQSPDKRRTAMDPALYTWKGYRNWSEKIRRDWKQDD